MKWQKAFLASALGVLIAGSLVFATVMLVFSAIGLFYKDWFYSNFGS